MSGCYTRKGVSRHCCRFLTEDKWDINVLLPRYQVYWLLMISVHVNGDAIVDMLAEMEVV